MFRKQNVPKERPIKLKLANLQDHTLYIFAELISADTRPIDPTLLFKEESKAKIEAHIKFLEKQGVVELIDGDITKVKLTQAGGRFAMDALRPFQRTPQERLRDRRNAQARGWEPLAPGLPVSARPGHEVSSEVTSASKTATPKSRGHLRSV